MDEIRKAIPITELLAGLAEEAAELAQAALKYRRALDKTNPTPIDEDIAYGRMCEEIADVRLYIKTIPVNEKYIENVMDQKLRRWADRIKESKKGA